MRSSAGLWSSIQNNPIYFYQSVSASSKHTVLVLDLKVDSCFYRAATNDWLKAQLHPETFKADHKKAKNCSKNKNHYSFSSFISILENLLAPHVLIGFS